MVYHLIGSHQHVQPTPTKYTCPTLDEHEPALQCALTHLISNSYSPYCSLCPLIGCLLCLLINDVDPCGLSLLTSTRLTHTVYSYLAYCTQPHTLTCHITTHHRPAIPLHHVPLTYPRLTGMSPPPSDSGLPLSDQYLLPLSDPNTYP